jgi:hypothetical protein
MLKKGLLFGVAVIVATLMACGGDKNSTVSPTSTAVDGTEAASDGSTLKVAAPTPTSPTNGVTLASRATTLIVTNASGTYVTPSNLKYRFAVETAAGATVITSGQITAGTSQTSYAVSETLLSYGTTYRWRARAEQGSLVGPWSSYWTFTTVTKIDPSQLPSYQTATELWDNLTDGKTIGTAVNATFVPGKGVLLPDFSSHVTYELKQTLTSGTMQFMIENLDSDTNGGKTKICSMQQGYGDITANAYRFNVEKRGDDHPDVGKFRMRIITGNSESGFYDSERLIPTDLDGSKAYWVYVSWGSGVVRLVLREGSDQGASVLDRSFNYQGTYQPSPHVVHIGAPVPRGGEADATVPGILVRYFHVSQSAPWPGSSVAADLLKLFKAPDLSN